MQKYWISFYSGYYEDEGCSKPPFQVWMSGQCERRTHLPQVFENGYEKDDGIWCALVESHNTENIWKTVEKHFPDYEERFCHEVESDWIPNDRFPDFQNCISLI